MTDEKVFFKYQKIDKYCIKNLSENQLYFRDPTKFNDLFDCQVLLDGRASKEDWIVRCLDRGMPLDEANALLSGALTLGVCRKEDGILVFCPDDEDREILKRERYWDLHWDLKIESIPGVCCFSKNDKNILMWSHCANEHRSICLRFRFGDGWISDNIREVKYVDEVYLLKAFDEDIESKVREVLCKKFSVWEYEQEYRIFLNANAFGKRVVKYEKTDLERVIFGLRISREDATSVYNIIRENYLSNGIDVDFCKAESVRGKYEIKYKKIDDIDEYLNGLEPALKLPDDGYICW